MNAKVAQMDAVGRLAVAIKGDVPGLDFGGISSLVFVICFIAAVVIAVMVFGNPVVAGDRAAETVAADAVNFRDLGDTFLRSIFAFFVLYAVYALLERL